MGLDQTLFCDDSDNLKPTYFRADDSYDHSKIIAMWRNEYAINNWIFKLVRKKTGFLDRHKLFDFINDNLIELTHDDLVKLKNDIICSRVRDGDFIYKNFSFVDVALAKIRHGKKVFYDMSW